MYVVLIRKTINIPKTLKIENSTKYKIKSTNSECDNIENYYIIKEVNQLLNLYEKYNIIDIADYSIPSLFADKTIGRNDYKKLKTTGKMYLFDIRIKSGPSIDYYVYSNGQLKRNNGKVVNSIQDIKGDLIEMWKDAKKNWFTRTFGYSDSVPDSMELTSEEIKKMKIEIPKAFDVVINKLMRS